MVGWLLTVISDLQIPQNTCCTSPPLISFQCSRINALYISNIKIMLEILHTFKKMGIVECRSYDSINVSSTWELTSVSMRYSQGDGVHTPLDWLVLYPRSVLVIGVCV